MSDLYDQDLFLGYLEGELSPQDVARFEQIMDGDVRLRRLVTRLQADRQSLRTLPQSEAPSDLMDPVRERLERDMLLGDTHEESAAPDRSPGSWGRWVAYSGVAALVMISATIVVLIFASSRDIWRGRVTDDRGAQLAFRSDHDRKEKATAESAPADTPDVAVGKLAMADGRRDGADDIAIDTITALRSTAAGKDSPGEHEHEESAKRDERNAFGDFSGASEALAAGAVAPGSKPDVDSTADPGSDLEDAMAMAQSGQPFTDLNLEAKFLQDEANGIADIADADQPFASLGLARDASDRPAIARGKLVPDAPRTRGEESTAQSTATSGVPAVQLEIVSRDPIEARKRLLSWASTRNIRVTEPAVQRRIAWRARGRGFTRSNEGARRAAPFSDAVFVMRAKAIQFRSLLAHMRQGADQTATIVPFKSTIAPHAAAVTTKPSSEAGVATLRANKQLEAGTEALEPAALVPDSEATLSRGRNPQKIAAPVDPDGARQRVVASGGASREAKSSTNSPKKLPERTAADGLPVAAAADVTLHVVIRPRVTAPSASPVKSR